MKRFVLPIVLVFVAACVGVVFFIARLARDIGDGERHYIEMVREGRVFEDALHAHDRSLHVNAESDDHGKTDVVVREVFDAQTQDQIIAWAKAAKEEKGILRPIVITFQHEIPHSDEPDIILREVEF